MFFADEVRPIEGIAPDSAKVDKRQLEMAMQLIGQYQGTFDPDKYHDEYRERLMGVIEAKRSGEGVKRAVESEAPAAPDLLAALQASLDEVKQPVAKKKKSPAKPAAKAGAGGGRATATRGRRAG
jgi:DNA end-binding protein Ku